MQDQGYDLPSVWTSRTSSFATWRQDEPRQTARAKLRAAQHVGMRTSALRKFVTRKPLYFSIFLQEWQDTLRNLSLSHTHRVDVWSLIVWGWEGTTAHPVRTLVVLAWEGRARTVWENLVSRQHILVYIWQVVKRIPTIPRKIDELCKGKGEERSLHGRIETLQLAQLRGK